MHRVNMDDSFDRLSVIESLTINNLEDIDFMEMLKILEPLVLVQVPENDSEENRRRLDYLLARTANLYAYLRVLWSAATNARAALKKGDAVAAEKMQKKKEALYEIGNAVKLKYEAVSRKITVALETEDKPERANYEARRERRDEPVKAAPVVKKQGGWGNVG
jgi:hypothetical protein